MRLTCPTCGATYEIDASVLPPGGRDVQCSNCGSTWFQEPVVARDEAVAAPETQSEAEDQTPEIAAPSDDAAAVPSSAPRRKRPDEAVLDVLRQEREHEARARAQEQQQEQAQSAPADEPAEEVPAPAATAEADDTPEANARRERARVAAAAALARSRKRAAARSGMPEPAKVEAAPEQIDAQTNDAIAAALDHAADDSVGLDDHPRDAMGQKRQMQSASAEAVDGAAEVAASRKSLLPDIEEINSTLRPDERASEQAEAAMGDPVAAAETRSGFRMGFSIVLLIALALVLLYMYAAPLGDAVPALAGPLETYRAWGDGLRLNLDARAADLADWLTSSVSSE